MTNTKPSGEKSAEEVNTEFRMIISHALLGCDDNIPKECWELVLDECTKFTLQYASQYANQQPVHNKYSGYDTRTVIEFNLSKDGKYLDRNDKEITTEMLTNHYHIIHEDWGILFIDAQQPVQGYSREDMMDIAGWMAAADYKRPIPELKEEAEAYIKALDF